MIANVFGLKVVTVAEDLAIIVGHRMALGQIGMEPLKSPDVVLNNVYTVNDGMLKRVCFHTLHIRLLKFR